MVIRRPQDLNAEWLSQVLGAQVAGFEAERIGTGQMSNSYRVTPAYADGAGPASVVVKLAAEDATSRATGVSLGIYEHEVRFYRELAPRIGGPLAGCLATAFDEQEGWFTLVLEDVAPARQGDQIAGCSVDEARLAMGQLARLHAPVFADPRLDATEWLNRSSPINQAVLAQLLAPFLERYGDRVAGEHRALCERFVAGADAWMTEREPPFALVHGDYRLDNMLLHPDRPGKVAAVLDWELSTLGDPFADLGLLYVYWPEPDDGPERQGTLAVDSVTALPGFPRRSELYERYAQRTGRDLSALPWYVGFGAFKLAVVCAGVAARGRAGAMIGEGFVEMAQRIGPLVRLGHGALDGKLR
jgi:hypothetical protein